MKFVLYLLVILVLGALARLFLGNRDKAKTVLELGKQSLGFPDLEKFKAWLIENACEQCGPGVRNDPLAMTRISEAAEKALTEFKADGRGEIHLPFLTADQSGPKHFNISFDSSKLQEI